MADYIEPDDEAPTRQAQINGMEVGQSVALAHRMDLSFGIDRDAVTRMTKLLRGNLDQQANRARKATRNEYTVENGSYLTSAGALIVCCTVTRTR